MVGSATAFVGRGGRRKRTAAAAAAGVLLSLSCLGAGTHDMHSTLRKVQRQRQRQHSPPLSCAGCALLARGGGGGGSSGVLRLFRDIFLPPRGGGVMEGGMDVESMGLSTRVGRFLKAVLHAVTGGGGAKGGGKSEAGEKGKKKKKKPEATKDHLGLSLKPGSVNYRIQKELKQFMAAPPDNCKVKVGKNIKIWIITIKGAEGTVFHGETFRLRVAFPDDYPTRAPSVYFLQKPPPPSHPHVYTNGDICLSLLGADWKPNLTVSSLALSILSMLSSAREKGIPQDNANHAGAKPGQAQDNWMYHDDNA